MRISAHNHRPMQIQLSCKNLQRFSDGWPWNQENRQPDRVRPQVIVGQSVVATAGRSGDIAAAEKYAHRRITAG
jgi:hypothetical protein